MSAPAFLIKADASTLTATRSPTAACQGFNASSVTRELLDVQWQTLLLSSGDPTMHDLSG
jgi:hypothetical protein